MHVLNYALSYNYVSGIRLHVWKLCKCLPARNETLPFTRVTVSPLLLICIGSDLSGLPKPSL